MIYSDFNILAGKPFIFQLATALSPANYQWNTHTDTESCFTKVVVEGELVIVPDLDHQFWDHFSLRFIQTPEMCLQTVLRDQGGAGVKS